MTNALEEAFRMHRPRLLVQDLATLHGVYYNKAKRQLAGQSPLSVEQAMRYAVLFGRPLEALFEYRRHRKGWAWYPRPLTDSDAARPTETRAAS